MNQSKGDGNFYVDSESNQIFQSFFITFLDTRVNVRQGFRQK